MGEKCRECWYAPKDTSVPWMCEEGGDVGVFSESKACNKFKVLAPIAPPAPCVEFINPNEVTP